MHGPSETGVDSPDHQPMPATVPLARPLLFLGDWYVEKSADAGEIVGDYPFVFNLESAISTRGHPTPGKINLRMSSNYILACFSRAPAAVNLANNHILDFGDEAFEDTLEELEKLGIAYFGAGRAGDNYHNPALIQVDGSIVALLGYVCPTTHPVRETPQGNKVSLLELSRIQNDIHHARTEGATKIVLSLHWGQEDVLMPKPADIALAHRLIDSGADLIIGHHAHVPQCFESYRGKTIAYGLGNFVFSDTTFKQYVTASEYISKPYHGHRLNKTSWGLVWSPHTGQTEIKRFYFEKERVRERPLLRQSPAWLKHSNSKYYPCRYRLHRYFRILAQGSREFFRNPTRVRPRHFVSFLKFVCSRRESLE